MPGLNDLFISKPKNPINQVKSENRHTLFSLFLKKTLTKSVHLNHFVYMTRLKLTKGNTTDQKNRGNGFPPEKIQQIKRAWLIHRCDSSVAKAMNVSKATVGRYRKVGKWDELARRADEKTNDKIVDQVSEETINSIGMIDDVTKWIFKTLKDFYDKGLFEPTVNDLDKMLRAGEFFRGGADSRPDNNVSTITQVIVNAKDEKEIDDRIENAFKTFFAGDNGHKSRL